VKAWHDEGGTVTRRAHLRGQDGFIREVVWIVVVLAVIGVVVLDGIAIFSAYQSADDAAKAAGEARTEYAQSLDMPLAKLAAQQYLTRSDLEMTAFKAERTETGTVRFTVTAKASADTYAFRYLGKIPQLEDWVERTTHPVRTGTAE
jgi:Flp pilus assembly protein TadG